MDLYIEVFGAERDLKNNFAVRHDQCMLQKGVDKVTLVVNNHGLPIYSIAATGKAKELVAVKIFNDVSEFGLQWVYGPIPLFSNKSSPDSKGMFKWLIVAPLHSVIKANGYHYIATERGFEITYDRGDSTIVPLISL